MEGIFRVNVFDLHFSFSFLFDAIVDKWENKNMNNHNCVSDRAERVKFVPVKRPFGIVTKYKYFRRWSVYINGARCATQQENKCK